MWCLAVAFLLAVAVPVAVAGGASPRPQAWAAADTPLPTINVPPNGSSVYSVPLTAGVTYRLVLTGTVTQNAVGGCPPCITRDARGGRGDVVTVDITNLDLHYEGGAAFPQFYWWDLNPSTPIPPTDFSSHRYEETFTAARSGRLEARVVQVAGFVYAGGFTVELFATAPAPVPGPGPSGVTPAPTQTAVTVVPVAKSWGGPVLAALPAGGSAVLESPKIAKGQTDASVKVQTPGDGAKKPVLYAPLTRKGCLYAYFGGARFKDHILAQGSYAVPWKGKDLFDNEEDPTLRTYGLLACLEVAKLYEQFKAQGARAAARSGCGDFALRPKLLSLDRATGTATYRMVRPSKRDPARRLKVSCRAVRDGLTLRVRTRSRRTKLRSVVGPRLQIGVYRSPAATGEGTVLAVFKR